MRNFYKNADGGMSVLFALALILCFIVVAFSMTTIKVQGGFERNYGATDASALGTAEWIMKGKVEKISDPQYANGRWMEWAPSQGEVKSYAEKIFVANMELDANLTDSSQRAEFDAKYNSGADEVTVTACSMVSKNGLGDIGGFGGAHKVCSESSASLEISKTISNAEIALSVDISGSMAENDNERMNALQNALNFLFDEYVTVENEDNLLFSIIPFSQDIFFKNYEGTIMEEAEDGGEYHFVPVFFSENLVESEGSRNWIGGESFVKLSKSTLPTRMIAADILRNEQYDEPTPPTPPTEPTPPVCEWNSTEGKPPSISDYGWVAKRPTLEYIREINDPAVPESEIQRVYEESLKKYDKLKKQYDEQYSALYEQYLDMLAEYEQALRDAKDKKEEHDKICEKYQEEYEKYVEDYKKHQKNYEKNLAEYNKNKNDYAASKKKREDLIGKLDITGDDVDYLQVQPLTNDIALLKNKVSRLVGYGGTKGLAGIAGAWLTVHKGWQGKWTDKSVDEERRNSYFNRSELPSQSYKKFIIHMSDGEDNNPEVTHNSNGVKYVDGFTMTFDDDFPSYGSAAYIHVCNAIKNQEIEIFIILMGTNRQSYHEACLGDGLKDTNIFDNIQPSKLKETYETIFDIIATKTNAVRLSK